MAANTSRDDIDGAPAAVRAALARVSLALKDQDCLGASLALVKLEKLIDTFAPVSLPAEADSAVHLIYFDDADMRPEVWIGQEASRARFKVVSTSWNAHLFVKLESNSADDRWAKNNRAPTSDALPAAVVADKPDAIDAGNDLRGTPGAPLAQVNTVRAPLTAQTDAEIAKHAHSAFYDYDYDRDRATAADVVRAIRELLGAGPFVPSLSSTPTGHGLDSIECLPLAEQENVEASDAVEVAYQAHIVKTMPPMGEDGRSRWHFTGGYTASLATDHAMTEVEKSEELRSLLREVGACFTRDDDLPADLLPRIDAALTGSAMR